MKKRIILVLGLFFSFACVHAQYKPEANTWSTELNYSPGGADNGTFQIPQYGAKVRYHLSNNLVLRLNLGLGLDRDITTSYYKDNDKEEEAYAKNFTNKFSLMPGVEYHFDRFERVSPYIGGELGFIAGNTGERADNTANDNYSEEKTPVFGFGMRVVSGFDVYLCKGLYLGAELGLGYEYGSTGRKSIDNNGVSSDGNTSTSTHYFGFNVNPALRIGWNF